jgi:RHS repeat-associated protein
MGCPKIDTYYTSQIAIKSTKNQALFYYSFGMEMKTFQADSNGYRYGFNGKELDKGEEGMGGRGSTYDYGFRIYNPQIGKFLSVDPLAPDYPWYTPYQFAGNTPIQAVDLDGLEPMYDLANGHNGEVTTAPLLDNSTMTHSGKDLMWEWSETNKSWSELQPNAKAVKVSSVPTVNVSMNVLILNKSNKKVDEIKGSLTEAQTILQKQYRVNLTIKYITKDEVSGLDLKPGGDDRLTVYGKHGQLRKFNKSSGLIKDDEVKKMGFGKSPNTYADGGNVTYINTNELSETAKTYHLNEKEMLTVGVLHEWGHQAGINKEAPSEFPEPYGYLGDKIMFDGGSKGMGGISWNNEGVAEQWTAEEIVKQESNPVYTKRTREMLADKPKKKQ